MNNRPAGEPQSQACVPLRSLRAGDVGLVTALRCCDGFARRLAEMGLTRGTTVEMIRTGAPCIVRVDHTRLSVGASLQDGVLLSPL
jgi:Fe2+ transport system protein FeoA